MSIEMRERLEETLDAAKKVIFGQDELLEGIIGALVCEGHLLIEGLPGLGKTLSISTMSRLCDLAFSRVQFTPDLLPSDLIGTMIYNQKRDEFTTKFGPIFTQLLLADEINRAPAKVQSALLEAMAEKQITLGDETHKLASPFVVLATQNPIEQEGTYNLPEAQLDRFMMKINVEYPDAEAEKKILGLTSNPTKKMRPILSTDDLLDLQKIVKEVYVDPKIEDLIIRIVRATRPQCEGFPKEYEGAVLTGASPRAGIWLHRLGKYMAFREGKDFVSPEHLFKVIKPVLGHRIIMSYEASIDKLTGSEVAMKIANQVL